MHARCRRSLHRLGVRALPSLVAAVLSVPAPASAQAPYEPNDSLAQAWGPLAGGTDYRGSFETGNDDDWFYFFTSRTAQFDIAFTAAACGGFYQWLLDADGRQITTSFGAHVGANSVAHTRLTLAGPARYHLQLKPGTLDCPWQFRIDPADAVTTRPESHECQLAKEQQRRYAARVRRDKRRLANADTRGERRFWRRRLRVDRRKRKQVEQRVVTLCEQDQRTARPMAR